MVIKKRGMPSPQNHGDAISCFYDDKFTQPRQAISRIVSLTIAVITPICYTKQ